VKTILNGQERQVDCRHDLSAREARESHSQDLCSIGDIIACGTSVGVGSMKPGSVVEVTIEGIGTLANR
jgi:2-keto-4-pentenoate hydratase/2-oxohepta-3-ene-1,7-dioic acid hydratase in catechol pathway